MRQIIRIKERDFIDFTLAFHKSPKRGNRANLNVYSTPTLANASPVFFYASWFQITNTIISIENWHQKNRFVTFVEQLNRFLKQ